MKRNTSNNRDLASLFILFLLTNAQIYGRAHGDAMLGTATTPVVPCSAPPRPAAADQSPPPSSPPPSSPTAREISNALSGGDPSRAAAASVANELAPFLLNLMYADLVCVRADPTPLSIPCPASDLACANLTIPYYRLARDGSNRVANYASPKIDADVVYAVLGRLPSDQCRISESVDEWLQSKDIFMCPHLIFPSEQQLKSDPHVQTPLYAHPYAVLLMKLIAKEHNHNCQIAEEMNSEDPYTHAKSKTIKTLQSIYLKELYPMFAAQEAQKYRGYEVSTPANICAEFAASTPSVIHSQMNSMILLLDLQYKAETYHYGGAVPMNGAYPYMKVFPSIGDDFVWRGMLGQTSRAIDPYYIDELRNFESPGTASSTYSTRIRDFFAIDIQRSRDLGIPSAADMSSFFLDDPKFDASTLVPEYLKELTDGLYGKQEMDGLLAILADQNLRLFASIFKAQFERVRHSDPGWFENSNEDIHYDNLATIIQRHYPAVGPISGSPLYAASQGNSTNPSQDDWKQVELLPGLLWLRWTLIEGNEIIFEVTTRSQGYVGIGFNKMSKQQMDGADIIFISRTGPHPTIRDMHGVGHAIYDDDSTTSGKTDVVLVSSEEVDGVFRARFKRPLKASDSYDLMIPANGQPISLLYAISPSSEAQYHGVLRRGATLLSIDNGERTEEINHIALYYHGSMMVIAWLVCIFTGNFVARNMKHKSWWYTTHKVIQGFTISSMPPTVLMGFTSNVTKGRHMSSYHAKMAVVLLCLTGLQALSGFSLAWLQKRLTFKQRRHIKQFHRSLGWILLFYATAVVFTGMQRMGLSEAFIQSFYTWVSMTTFCLITVECLRTAGKWPKSIDVQVFEKTNSCKSVTEEGSPYRTHQYGTDLFRKSASMVKPPEKRDQSKRSQSLPAMHVQGRKSASTHRDSSLGLHTLSFPSHNKA
eukprot:TRINITY_DN3753_c0_g1_i7.p1 TRINITY_DN3753_c0_g1~~TRINITY_DN3753_c0_g1_i7.p1  ORF type:complete len:932 (+),score=158.84 TRINITY_DN3753_c0_g1_i7:122-2917(+)